MEQSKKKPASKLFNNIEDVKSFLQWAKAEGIQYVELGDVKVQFSALAFVPSEELKEISHGSAKTLAETEPSDEDEDLLFHSSN